VVEIEIDGRTYRVQEGESLLPTCLRLGLRLPYFCWHPALGSVGACRQCAVVQYQDAGDTRGRLVMACMTPVRAGLRIGLEHPRARRFRASVVECLMVGHPHDCPVCEEGGECHLQDMTVMTGHVRRRYRGPKRTHRNQDLGPFLNHEMNRCIACYRCLRFYRDYAGGEDLQVFASGHRVWFGRYRDGPLENEFSGNLVEVCPTGVFTDRTFSAHYVRKWDQAYAPSLCPHCGLGCNTSPGARAGQVRRILNRFHPRVNGHFLCDRGRFGYAAANQCRGEPLLDGEAVAPGAAVAQLRHWLEGGPVLGIGSPRASLESNFALQRLVGEDNYYLSLSAGDRDLLDRARTLLARPGIRSTAPLDCERSDAVLVLGEDVTQTAPRLALALRQAVLGHARDRAEALGARPWQAGVVQQSDIGLRHPLFLLVPHTTRLGQVAAYCQYGAPQDLAEQALVIAAAIEAGEAPGGGPAADIATTLCQAERPLIVCGTSCRSLELLAAAEAVALALAQRRRRPTDLVCIVPECNSLGAALLGGGTLDEALSRLEDDGVYGLIVLEDDLYLRAPAARLDAVLNRLERLAVIDAWEHRTARRARLFLPAAPWTESAGTWVSLEGRAQRFYAVQPPGGHRRCSWRWLARAGAGDWPDLESLVRELAASHPQFAPLTELIPHSPGPIPRQPYRFSGRTALYAPARMHEPPPPPDPDSPLVHSMEGLPPHLQPAGLRPYRWQPGWNSHPGALNADPEAVADSGVRLSEGFAMLAGMGTGLPGRRESIPGGSGSGHPGRVRLPAAPPPPRRAWRLIPRYHLFGSEPLSTRAPAVAARTPQPYLALNPHDAAELGLVEEAKVRVRWDGEELVLPLRPEPGLGRGVAALPWGLVPWFPPGAEIILEPLEEKP